LRWATRCATFGCRTAPAGASPSCTLHLTADVVAAQIGRLEAPVGGPFLPLSQVTVAPRPGDCQTGPASLVYARRTSVRAIGQPAWHDLPTALTLSAV